MNKLSKVITIMLIIMMLVTVATTVFAAGGVPTPSQVNAAAGTADVSGITNLGNSIVQILTTIGVIASVIVLVVLGIKYMMGSAEEKAEYKKTLIPYIIGAGLVFAASGIANVVYNFMHGAI